MTEDVKIFEKENVLPGGNYYGQNKDGSIDRSVCFGWRPWTLDDLDPNDKVTFVPYWLPEVMHPLQGPDGERYIYLSVNDLGCWLQVGRINTTSAMFYHAYKNVEDQLLALQRLKKFGPPNMLWSKAGYNGTNTWHYVAEAMTFGFDADGKYWTGKNLLSTSWLYKFFMLSKFGDKYFTRDQKLRYMYKIGAHIVLLQMAYYNKRRTIKNKAQKLHLKIAATWQYLKKGVKK